MAKVKSKEEEKLEIAERIYLEQLERLVRMEIDDDYLKSVEISLPHGEKRKKVLQRQLTLKNNRDDLMVLLRAIDRKIAEYKRGVKNAAGKNVKEGL